MGFVERREQHDTRALPLVRSAFGAHGFRLYPFGGELSPELQEMLRRLQNGTSRMLRYRPDMVAVHPAKGSLLLEVKSEGTNSPNFAVEFDAWDAARLWNQNGRRVLYVFADLVHQNVLASWPEDLCPRRVFVPRREDLNRIRTICPGTLVRYYPAVRGSGTAFFLVAKSDLKPTGAALLSWLSEGCREGGKQT